MCVCVYKQDIKWKSFNFISKTVCMCVVIIPCFLYTLLYLFLVCNINFIQLRYTCSKMMKGKIRNNKVILIHQSFSCIITIIPKTKYYFYLVVHVLSSKKYNFFFLLVHVHTRNFLVYVFNMNINSIYIVHHRLFFSISFI